MNQYDLNEQSYTFENDFVFILQKYNRMNRFVILIFLLVCPFVNTSAKEKDSITVVIRNKMTGKAVNWDYTLSLYSNKDTMVTHSIFSKAAILKTWPSEFLTLRLDVYDHSFTYDFHSSIFEDISISEFNYNLNFDEPFDKICDRVYVTDDLSGTTVQLFCRDNSECCNRDSNIPHQSLQLVYFTLKGFVQMFESEV